MGMFVHLASEDAVQRIGRGGIRGRTVWIIGPDHKRLAVGASVYCMPVVPNFYATHQWVRELKRSGRRTISGVYFKLPGTTKVWAGMYNEPHELVTASQAAARLMRTASAEGFEVVLPRGVAASEIHSIRTLPQTLGWRYFPGSHQRGIFCRCESCNAGGIKARRMIVADVSTRNPLSLSVAEAMTRESTPDPRDVQTLAKRLRARKRARKAR